MSGDNSKTGSSNSCSGNEKETHKSTSISEDIQNSYIQKIPSFERDDDLTVVTTAESTQGSSMNIPNLHHQRFNRDIEFMNYERAKENSDRIASDFSSVSVDQPSNQNNTTNNAGAKSSLAAAAAGLQSYYSLQNKQSRNVGLQSYSFPNKQLNKRPSFVSVLSSDSFHVAPQTPPPPGFVTSISGEREKVNFKNNNHYSHLYGKDHYNRNYSAGSRYDELSGSRYMGGNQRFHGSETNLIFADNGIWGSLNQDRTDKFSDNISHRSMPSMTVASSQSQSTSSNTTCTVGWKKHVHSELDNGTLTSGQQNLNDANISLGEFSSSSLPPFHQYSGKRLGGVDLDNRSHSFQTLSTPYQSYCNGGGCDSKVQKDDNITMGSRAVQAFLSAPNEKTLLQTGGYSMELEESSSSNSSFYSDSPEPPFSPEPTTYKEPKEAKTLSFAIPPINEENDENLMLSSFNEKNLPSFPTINQTPILPRCFSSGDSDEAYNLNLDDDINNISIGNSSANKLSPRSRKREWRLKMMRKLSEIPVGELNPDEVPIFALMNEWAKTKSVDGANMVEMLLNRANAEVKAGNTHVGVQLTTKMYTIAVDAWAKSKEGVKAALRAESILQHMNEIYKSTENKDLKPATGIFNAVVNAWAQSKDKRAALRCEQILDWMDTLHKNGNVDVKPDTYTYNTCMHALAQNGDKESARKALGILDSMNDMYRKGNLSAKPETISFNIVINSLAKSKEKGAAAEAEKLLHKMQSLHETGELDVKPNVVSYGAVIDAYAKSMEPGAASRADVILANMIQLYKRDTVTNADLRPNTHVFNSLINCWSKSNEEHAASRAEEVLMAMSSEHEKGTPSIKPDSLSYTAVIDAWAKSGYSGAALRAEALLNKMELKYMAGDADLKPTTYTYNAVIHSLAKSGEAQAASRAEKVLQNMVNRYRAGGSDVMPTTINFNTVLGAWAKSNSGRAGAERAERILEWMDDLRNSGNTDIKPDTISFNACIDAWARSGDKKAAERAEQILRHMDQLYAAGNKAIKADSYSYNTVLNAWAKSGLTGAPQRAERILSIMETKYRNGDVSLKPNTRTYTTVVDTWAKSNERNAARKAEEILAAMQSEYERTKDNGARPNTATANAVMNSCAFTKVDSDKPDALTIAFRAFDWLSSQVDIGPDAYTYTIMLSVCSNLLPRRDTATRYLYAQKLFLKCRESGYVNDFVLRKLRHTVTEEEYMSLVEYRVNSSARNLPSSWTRNTFKTKPRNRCKKSR